MTVAELRKALAGVPNQELEVGVSFQTSWYAVVDTDYDIGPQKTAVMLRIAEEKQSVSPRNLMSVYRRHA